MLHQNVRAAALALPVVVGCGLAPTAALEDQGLTGAGRPDPIPGDEDWHATEAAEEHNDTGAGEIPAIQVAWLSSVHRPDDTAADAVERGDPWVDEVIELAATPAEDIQSGLEGVDLLWLDSNAGIGEDAAGVILDWFEQGGVIAFLGYGPRGCNAFTVLDVPVHCASSGSSPSGEYTVDSAHSVSVGVDSIYVLGGEIWSPGDGVEVLAADEASMVLGVWESGSSAAIFIADDWPAYNEDRGTGAIGTADNGALIENVYAWTATRSLLR